MVLCCIWIEPNNFGAKTNGQLGYIGPDCTRSNDTDGAITYFSPFHARPFTSTYSFMGRNNIPQARKYQCYRQLCYATRICSQRCKDLNLALIDQ